MKTLLVLAMLCLPLPALAAPGLTLLWQDNANNEDGFSLERRTAPGGSYLEITQTPTNVVTYRDEQTLLNQWYCYRVRAFNTAGVSGYSNEACGRLTLSGPTNLTVQ